MPTDEQYRKLYKKYKVKYTKAMQGGTKPCSACKAWGSEGQYTCSWCKQYFHEATDMFKDDYTDVFISGQTEAITLQVNYGDFKKLLKSKKV